MDTHMINMFSSVLVMFFIFFIIVKWFLGSFEKRIVFIENLYYEMRNDIKLLTAEIHSLNETIKDFKYRVLGINISRVKIVDDDSEEVS